MEGCLRFLSSYLLRTLRVHLSLKVLILCGCLVRQSYHMNRLVTILICFPLRANIAIVKYCDSIVSLLFVLFLSIPLLSIKMISLTVFNIPLTDCTKYSRFDFCQPFFMSNESLFLLADLQF